MEQTRLVLAIALSFLVFLIWSIAFAPEKAQKAAGQNQALKAAEIGDAAKSQPAAMAENKENQERQEAPRVEETHPERSARTISVETPLYHMTLSEKGAAVISMELKGYRETVAPGSANKELIPKGLSGGTVLASFNGGNAEGLEQAFFSAEPVGEQLTVMGQPADQRFSYRTPEGLRIEKSYRFYPDSYLVDLNITVHNGSERAISGTLKVGLRNLMEPKALSYGFQGPSGIVDHKLEQIKVKDIEKQNKLDGTVHWVAIEELYFMESLISKTPTVGSMLLSYRGNVIENQLATELSDIAPGASQSMEYSLFMGPKSISVLKAADNELDRAINFGWVEIIAKPCLYFMNFIYRYIPNYGFAIILLTVITRLIFWPLAHKSYKSMNDMRKLQPLMQELREKYKDDKAKLNQETMALYRTYKVNPMGGCLPMIIQLPVFFALYRMLYQAIELRHAPFFGWINDLSAPDRLFHFGFKIPFMNEPYGIPVLTLIMGATMILQQKLSPQPGDPAQAKMMMLMPIVFTFIFINFPSGLVLYWLVSNMVSIGQQYYTNMKLA